MIIDKDGEFGSVLAIINGLPYRFIILGERIITGPEDPLDWHQYELRFFDKRLLDNSTPINFVLRPLSTVMPFGGKVSEDQLDQIIKFAIFKIKETPNIVKFNFATEDYNQGRNIQQLNGQQVRLAILRFIQFVNNQLPNEYVSNEDIFFNINANKNIISQWTNDLFEQGYLMLKIIEIPIRFSKGKKSEITYKINPIKRDDIRRELTKLSSLLEEDELFVFISYNTIDKNIAGELKRKLEKPKQSVFLAHEDIKPTIPWEQEILNNLEKCHIFIPIITVNYHRSLWTDQELGYAIQGEINNTKRIIAIFKGKSPYGFAGRFQAMRIDNKEIDKVAEEIQQVIDEQLLRQK
jgi:hypothetical protein